MLWFRRRVMLSFNTSRSNSYFWRASGRRTDIVQPGNCLTALDNGIEEKRDERVGQL
jgi:hypothetical protein